MKRSLLISLLVLLALQLAGVTAWAQRESENWHFGRRVSLSFATGEPVSSVESQIDTREGCASMSDSAGNLLFYSDGSTVWSSDNSVMTNGTRLMGDKSSTQSCIVIPWPGTPGKYYLFTVDNSEDDYVNGLRYSVINMNVQSGLGAVEEKNILLDAPAAEKVTAVRHNNGTDVWVIGHLMNSSVFTVYLITESGISSQPIYQDIGPTLNTRDCGYLKSNLQGDRLAMACSGPSGLFLFSFDNRTGKISNADTLTTSVTYGLEFSPSGQFLYASSWVTWPIYQYDLSLPPSDIGPQGIVVAPQSQRGALQLAPNGRIYGVLESSSVLEVIYAPNNRGASCGYVSRDYTMRSAAALGLPNFFPAVLSTKVNFDVRLNAACVGDTVVAELLPRGRATQIQWEVGDSSYPLNPADTHERIQAVYRTAGEYSITVRFVSPSGVLDSVKKTVTVMARPIITMSADTTICRGETARITAGSNSALRWLPHSDIADMSVMSIVVRPQNTTTYHVIASNGLCSSVDSVTVVVFLFDQISMGDTIVKVRPGERQTIPVKGSSNAMQFLPLHMEIRSLAHVGTVNVAPAAGVRVISRTETGGLHVLTVDVDTISTPPTILTMDVVPLLSTNESKIEIGTTGTGCVNPDASTVILVSENCAGPIRNVTIGSSAPTTIAMMPNPIGTSGTIVWQSPAIGEHEISIYSAGGSLIRTFTVERTVDSPTTGEIILDRSGLAAGLYRIVMQVRMSSTVQSCPLYVY